LFVFIQFISSRISQDLIQYFSAKLHSTGFKINHSFLIKSHDSIAHEYVGISFKSRLVSIFVLIQRGLIHIKNSIENIIIAKRKFIKTQANIIIACCHAGLFIRL
jgi:hypothetical protein